MDTGGDAARVSYISRYCKRIGLGQDECDGAILLSIFGRLVSCVNFSLFFVLSGKFVAAKLCECAPV